MKAIRMGVIGCGEIAQVMHLPYLAELPAFEITGISDLSERVLNRVGDAYAVPHRSHDYGAIFPYVDAVAVLTPDHVDIVEAAAHAGKHIFVEKPLSFSPSDCDRILEAVAENGVTLMVGYMKRFDPGYEYGVRHIRELDGVNLIRMHDFAGSFKTHPHVYTLVTPDDVEPEVRASLQQTIDGEMLSALGPGCDHLVRTLYLVLMSGIHDLTVLRGAFGQAEGVLYSSPLGDIGLVSILDYGEGRRCVYEIDLHTGLVRWDQSLTAYGRDRVVSIEFPNPYIRYAPSVVTISENDGAAPVTRQSPVSYDEAFRREWLHFASCLHHGHEPLTNGRDAKADVELALSIVRAIAGAGNERQPNGTAEMTEAHASMRAER